MSPESLHYLIMIVIPAVIGLGAFIMKSIINRIDELEKKTLLYTSEPQVRLIINDKLDPIKEDLREIKNSLNRLYNLYFNQMTKDDEDK